MKTWQTLSHVKWDCKYHIVFVTKYRHKTYMGISEEGLGLLSGNYAIKKGLSCMKGTQCLIMFIFV